MRTLVVGAGALGGLVAARLAAAGAPVSLATRDDATAARLRAAGLRVSGVGGAAAVDAPQVAPLDRWRGEAFDLVVLATKAQDALAVAPAAAALLAPGGTLLPIQNGAVPQVVGERLGGERVLGALSNLGATMKEPGVYEQRNAGHLLVGELSGGPSARAERVKAWLGRAVEVRVTPNLRGAMWSKLLLNCAGTTLGAIAGGTMREVAGHADGRALFDRTYAEGLAVALASGARPEKMIVDPVPPVSADGARLTSTSREHYEAWRAAILAAYGDNKPSMLQDLERGRPTEIDFINGHVVSEGRRLGVPTPINAAVVETVHALSRGELSPSPVLLGRVLERAGRT
jgi:2-dehydropantoate 2-reductase